MKKLMVVLLSLVCAVCATGAVLASAAASVTLVPKEVNYSPANGGWDAYMVNFAGSTQNPNENNVIGTDNPYAMNKITYERGGSACEVRNIYVLGTNLAAFIHGADGNRVGAPQQGDKLTVLAGCGFLENEATDKDYVFLYNGSRFELQGAVEEPLPPESECTEITIKDLYHNPAWNSSNGAAIQIDFNNFAGGLGEWGVAATGTDYIKYVDTFGREQPIADFIYLGGTNMLMRIGQDLDHVIDKVRMGDKITFQKGLRLNKNEMLKQDVTYVIATPSTSGPVAQPLFVSDPTEFELIYAEGGSHPAGTTCQLEWTIGPESAYATPAFESLDTEIATVDENGLITFKKEGSVTIRATVFGTLKEEATFSVTAPSEIKKIEDTIYTVWVMKGDDLAYPTDWKYEIVYENDAKGPVTDLIVGENLTVDETSFKKDEVGDYQLPAKITANGKQYDTQVTVSVYEPMDLIVKELGIVDWFSYATFIQYPDSSLNDGNLTDTSSFENVLDKLEYKRADGTVVEWGYYMLSGGNFCVMPRFLDSDVSIDNFNKAPYYQEGDTITIKAGMQFYRWTGALAPTETDRNAIKPGTGMCVVETVCREDMTYRFDGNIWGFFKEYTGLSVESETIAMSFGEKKDAGAQRVPSNATSGTISYQSADEKIAKVNSRGSIEGVGVGTTTITVTLDGGEAGTFTKTISVIVSDALTGIALTPGTIEIKAGEDLLSMLTAKTVWASGKAGSDVDLSGAQIVGFDPENTADEQTVTVKVTVDGQELSGTVIVRVQKSGCGSRIGSAAPIALAAVGLACALLLRKKNRGGNN